MHSENHSFQENSRKALLHEGGYPNGKDKIFRYNDQSERYHSMNKIYILATTILWLQFIIYLLLKLNSNSIVSITAYSNLALIALFAIGNVIIFVRQKEAVS